MSDVKISINIVNGNIDIEAPTEALDEIVRKIEVLIPKLIDARNSQPNRSTNVEDNTKISSEEIVKPVQVNGPKKTKNNKKVNAKSNSKLESYKLTDVSKEKKDDLCSFYSQKSPTIQKDQVLTIMYWFKKNMEVNNLGVNEIYTGFRVVNVKVPKRISSVLSNLKLEDKISGDSNNGYYMTHVGEGYVEKDLPQADN